MRISDWSSDVCSSDLLYLDIEQVRFPDRLQVEVLVPKALENACVPVLILQPIIENALKYGVAPSKGRIAIRLTASSEHGLLVVRAETTSTQRRRFPRPEPASVSAMSVNGC